MNTYEHSVLRWPRKSKHLRFTCHDGNRCNRTATVQDLGRTTCICMQKIQEKGSGCAGSAKVDRMGFDGSSDRFKLQAPDVGSELLFEFW